VVKKKDATVPIAEKCKMINPTHKQLSIRRQCELLGLARATYFGVVTRDHEAVVDKDAKLRGAIDKIYTDHPYYGARRITWKLRTSGLRINRKKVRRLMLRMGIESVLPKPNTSKPHPGHKIYPYLLRGLKIVRINQVWSTDITYIPTEKGFCYLVAIIDWYSRKVLAHKLANTMDVSFCLDVYREATLRFGVPEIFNSDQGSQFTSDEFTKMVIESGARFSMDGKGRAIDNVFIERLWWSLKYEDVYIRGYGSIVEARKGITKYFEWYNTKRPHQSLNYNSPDEVYFTQTEVSKAA
jgi:putative transposase